MKASLPFDLNPILLAQGLETWAVLGETELLATLGSALDGPSTAGSGSGGSTLAVRARAAIVVALPYDPRPESGTAVAGQDGESALNLRVAAFASCHRYAALARLLKNTARQLAGITGFPYQDFRVAVNSRLPEKNLVERAGLGFRGRSDLLLSHAYGPACILGLLLLPFEPLAASSACSTAQGPGDPGWVSPCDSCRACADACPGRAIDGSRNSSVRSAGPKPTQEDDHGLQETYHKEACLQHWMSIPEDPPAGLRSAFKGHLYGCDICILACPLSARAWLPDREDGTSPARRAAGLLLPEEERPGATIPAAFLLKAGDKELKAFFRKTALGLSWFGPGMLRRNTALGIADAAGAASIPQNESGYALL